MAKNLNPNNPVARAANDNRHKICAIVMHKLGVKHIELTDADINAIPVGTNLGISDNKGYTEVFFMTPEESAVALKKIRWASH